MIEDSGSAYLDLLFSFVLTMFLAGVVVSHQKLLHGLNISEKNFHNRLEDYSFGATDLKQCSKRAIYKDYIEKKCCKGDICAVFVMESE